MKSRAPLLVETSETVFRMIFFPGLSRGLSLWDNVRETSASLISRRVTWGLELRLPTEASSRTKRLAQGDTAGLVPPRLAPHQVGVCLLGGPGPPWRGTQHTASAQFNSNTNTAHVCITKRVG